MSRISLLEQLRAERERNEAEITAPVRAELSRTQASLAWQHGRVRAMSRFLANGIEARLLEAIRARAADLFAPAIMRALRAPTGREPIAVFVTLDDLRFLLPDGVDAAILKKARAKIGERLEVDLATSSLDREQYYEVLRFHIPSTTVEVPVAVEALQPPRRRR